MYTNGTTNYNLPQYVDSDKATWTDLNAPFNAIDAAIKGAVDDTAQEALDIDALKARMDTAEQNIGTNTTNIAGLDTRLTTAEGAITSQASQIADVKQDTEDMICAYNEASATSTHRYEVGDYFIYNDVLYRAIQTIEIGDTIVPDTNCSTTNVTTELLATEDLSGDVEQLQTDVSAIQAKITHPTVLLRVAADTVTTFRSQWEQIATYLRDNVTGNDNTKISILFDNRFLRVDKNDADEVSVSGINLGLSGTLSILSMTYRIATTTAVIRHLYCDLSITPATNVAMNGADPYANNVATSDAIVMIN